MSNSLDEDEELFPGWATISRYPAMLGGTVAGQLAGIAIDAVVGTRSLWIPIACSVVLEALVGARFGASRGLAPVTRAQQVRVSVTYTCVLAAISAPLLVWVGASHAEAVPGGVGLSFLTPATVALAIGVLLAATAIRAALLSAFAPRRP